MIPCNVVYDEESGQLLIRVPVGDEDDVVLARIDISEGEGAGGVGQSSVPAAEMSRLGKRLGREK